MVSTSSYKKVIHRVVFLYDPSWNEGINNVAIQLIQLNRPRLDELKNILYLKNPRIFSSSQWDLFWWTRM